MIERIRETIQKYKYICKDRDREKQMENEKGAHRRISRGGMARGPKERETESQKPQTKANGMEGGRERRETEAE